MSYAGFSVNFLRKRVINGKLGLIYLVVGIVALILAGGAAWL